MDTSASERSVRLPTFDGDEKNFQLWWMRFCAYARVYKFASAAKRVRDSNLPLREDETIDVTTDPGKQRAEAKRANDVCMANLTMAFTSEKLMGLVYKATTTAWPSGQAYLVIDALFKRYVPQDLISKVELRREVNKVSMKKEEDPANLFEALSAIENKYNTAVFQIQSDELIATVLEKAPREYMSVLTTEQRVQGTRLTMNHLEEAMTQLYRSLYGSGSEEKGDEIGLRVRVRVSKEVDGMKEGIMLLDQSIPLFDHSTTALLKAHKCLKMQHCLVAAIPPCPTAWHVFNSQNIRVGPAPPQNWTFFDARTAQK